MGSTHPAPLVRHPFLKVEQAAFDVAEVGAFEHSMPLQDVVGSC